MKSQESSNRQIGTERVASPEQMGGETAEVYEHRSPLSCEACISVLHDLNNAFAAVLLNAQVMECKLPSYSRSKRYIHEIERGAQRGGALLKRLLAQFAGDCEYGRSACLDPNVPPVGDSAALMATQEPLARDGMVLRVTSPSITNAAPVFGAK